MLFVVALVVRLGTANRHVKARLLASAVTFALYAALAVMLRYSRVSDGMQEPIAIIHPLLLVFGTVNGLVALIINPWRIDRLPDRFPTIVQDTIVISVFALGATLILQERVFATTAVGAVVIGFALQDTLGNLFAGLAIQIEKPFRVGHWVRIADTDGQVSEITWRATKLRTKAGNFVVVPNSKLSDDIIINYSEPSLETLIEVDVGVSYDAMPNDVKHVIREAIRDEPLITTTREPEILIADFAASSVNYRIRVWTLDFAADEQLRDRVRSSLYYAFRRNGIVIPYPIQTEIQVEPASVQRDVSRDERTLRQVSVFASLDDEQRARLAQEAASLMFAAGEVVVREGAPGTSMFVVSRGEVVVTIDPDQREVARIGPGGFFGEMSLLTGAPRNATVRAVVDSELIEVRVEAFRRFVMENPAAVQEIGVAVARRRAELEERRAAGSAAAPAEPPQGLVDRIWRFLRLEH